MPAWNNVCAATLQAVERVQDEGGYGAKNASETSILERMRLSQPTVVQKLCASRNVALMLLQTGELFHWTSGLAIPKPVPFPLVQDAAEKTGTWPTLWTVAELLHYPMVTERTGGPTGLLDLASSVRIDKDFLTGIKIKMKVSEESARRKLASKIAEEADKRKPRVLNISAGNSHYCAITKQPSLNLYTWGRNNYGQLGHGDFKNRSIPTPVRAMESKMVVEAKCGVSCFF